jgi:septal ring factor EnvC (AmiA/AmiB activator)
MIKRMEPLTEENKKLEEAVNASERNIQRARHERDLAESNARDLEYQKGVLSEQLAAASQQLWSQSEQLATVSRQLKGASEQLEQKSKQLRMLSEQKTGTVCQRMYFVLLNNHIFGDNCCACRTRCRAQPTAPGHRTTSIGESEGVRASRQTGRGAKR